MGMSADSFARHLKSLLPRGALWNLEPESWISKTLLAVADELARIDGRTEDLIEELDPSTTDELLEDWERALGLPSPCVTVAQTFEERRDAVVGALNSVGGNSIQYFVGLASSLLSGAAITILEDSPFLIGEDGMGDEIGGDEWTFVWHVTAPISLSTAQRQSLECNFRRLRPAHTFPTFTYV
jgi:uncharacterized protein YmfQ (DUF2313 family)